MISLDQDLKSKKSSLKEFEELTKRVLKYLPNVLSGYNTKSNYRIYSSKIAGTTKYLRPINENLFTFEPEIFEEDYKKLKKSLASIKNNFELSKKEKSELDSTLYTIQQSIGIGLDLVVGSNSARKHVGNRFEELITVVFSEMGIANKKIILKIPYETNEGSKLYKCENDLILSPYESVKSTSETLDKNEIVVSIKTTSKDRMGKMFIDKMLLERFVGHDQKVIGIFLNDVQRKETNNISYTLVSGLFMVYSKFLTELEGIYYLDPPPNAFKQPYKKYMNPFSELLTKDVFQLLAS